MARRLTITEQRDMRRTLEDAQESLKTYLDPENENCSVRPEARESSRTYLDTWVLMGLENALAALDRALEDS